MTSPSATPLTRAYFVSDLHLYGEAAGEDPNTTTFLNFLKRLRLDAESEFALEKPTHLFLVGDIFDLWVGGHEYFQSKFPEIIAEIRALVRGGVEVHYFEGNHDFHLKNFWERELGVRVHAEGKYFELAGRTVRVEHGDLINPNDKGYLWLRWFFRTSVMKTLALNLPGRVVRELGERASHASRGSSSGRSVSEEKIRAMVLAHAKRAMSEKPFDLIITGHVHVVDDIEFTVAGRKCRSVNLGSWFDGAHTLLLSEGGAKFLDLNNID